MANKSQEQYTPPLELCSSWKPQCNLISQHFNDLLKYQFRNLSPIDKAKKPDSSFFSHIGEEREKLRLVLKEPFRNVLVELVQTCTKQGAPERNADSGRGQNPPTNIKIILPNK